MRRQSHRDLASLDWEIAQIAAFLTRLRDELKLSDEAIREVLKDDESARERLETASDLASEIDFRVMHRLTEIRLKLKKVTAEEHPSDEGDAS